MSDQDAIDRIAAILQRLKRSGGHPIPAMVLARRADVSKSGARAMADRLVEQGLAVRTEVAAGSITRPAWIGK